MKCSNRSSDSDDAHICAEVVPLRHDGKPGIYEFAAAPARAILRKILESSLRTLIEHLVLSDTAKYGTWASVRPLDSPQRTSSAIRDVATHSSDRSVILTWQISFEAIKALSGKANELLHVMANTRSAPVPLLMPKHILSNTPSPIFPSWAGDYRLSNSGVLTLIGSGARTDLLCLRLPKLLSEQTDRRKIARLHLLDSSKHFGLFIAMYTTKGGHCLLLQPIDTHQPDECASNSIVAHSRIWTDYLETGHPRVPICKRHAWLFKSWSLAHVSWNASATTNHNY